MIEFCSATAVWCYSGMLLVPICWMLLCNRRARFSPQALLFPDLAQNPLQIIRWFILRWQVEVTFQEARAYRTILDRDPAGCATRPARSFSSTAGTASPTRCLRTLSRPCGGRSGAQRVYSHPSANTKQHPHRLLQRCLTYPLLCRRNGYTRDQRAGCCT